MRIDLSGLVKIGAAIVDIVKGFADSPEVKEITKEATEGLKDEAIGQFFKALELKADEKGMGAEFDSAMLVMEKVTGVDIDKDGKAG